MGDAQPLHPVDKRVHMLLTALQVTAVRREENIAKQALHLSRSTLTELHDRISRMHTPVVYKHGKILGCGFEPRGEISIAVLKPHIPEGFQRSPLKELIVRFAVKCVHVLCIAADECVQSLFVHIHRISHTKTALSLTSISSGSIAMSAGAPQVTAKSALPTEQLVGEYRCSSPQL